MNNVVYEFRSEIEENGNLIAKVGYKPFKTIYIVAIAAVVILVFTRNLFGLLFCVFGLGLSGWVHYSVKDHLVMEVYDDAILLMDPTNEKKAARIPLDDIYEWNVNKNNENLIRLIFADNTKVEAMTYQTNEAVKALKVVLAGKSSMERLEQRNKSKKASGFSFWKK